MPAKQPINLPSILPTIQPTIPTKQRSIQPTNQPTNHATNQPVANWLDAHLPGLQELFKSIDTDGSGTITVEEMRKAISTWGHKINEVGWGVDSAQEGGREGGEAVKGGG